MERSSTINANHSLLERQIPLVGAANFRDLGGLPSRIGKVLKRGVIFRSDDLCRLSTKDLEALQSRQIQTVIDLRSLKEASDYGAFDNHGFVGAELHSISLEDLSSGAAKEQDQGDYLTQKYLHILQDSTSQLRKVLRLLSSPDSGPTVFHCAVGKDRTGIVAMLVLGLLEVADESIVADYCLSDAAMEQLLVLLDGLRPDLATTFRNLPKPLLCAQEETAINTLEWIHKTHGGFESYALEIGVSPTEIASLRRRLLH